MSTIAQHTPGPWDVNFGRDDAVVHAGVTIASISDDAVAWQANAHLIAAAPDVLEALKAMESLFNHPGLFGLMHKAKRSGWTAAAMQERIQACITARAAIAKAEGRS